MGALLLVFLLLLALAVAAPKVARSMQREREQESARRASQYVRAIRVYYRKLGHYPGSVEQLEKTNNQRFLRQRYIDPLTGKADWRLIHVGENQTKVKGFFGQELQGLQSGLGSAAGMASTTGGGASAGSGSGSAFNNSSLGGGGSFGGSTIGGTSSPVGGGQTGLGSGSVGTTSTGTGSQGGTGVSSQSATDAIGTGGPIMGVGSAKTGEAMLVVNEQGTYDTWEFLYDPRIEQLYAKGNLLGGSSSGGTSVGLGSLGGSSSGSGGSSNGAGSGMGTGSGTGTGTGTSGNQPTTPR